MTSVRLAQRTRALLVHSRAQVAIKAGIAASLSWVVAEVLTGFAGSLALGQYMYYAPLGAVVTVHPTVANSMRNARSALFALVLGAALGLLVHGLLEPGPLSLALVVVAGVALGGLPWLGSQRTRVVIIAMFVLIIGGGHPVNYALSYMVLIIVGGGCAVAVNLALPTFRLTQSREALQRLRDLTAAQLHDLARDLRDQPPPTRGEWERRLRAPQPQTERSRQAVREAADAQRANPRARRHVKEVAAQQANVRMLRRIAALVEDLPEMLLQAYPDNIESGPLDADLAEAISEALERLAHLAEAYDSDLPADDSRVRAVELSIEQLTRIIDHRRDLDAGHLAVLGIVFANLVRASAAVTPDDQSRA